MLTVTPVSCIFKSWFVFRFIFIPFYLRTKISTLPEFLEKRYDSRSRIILAIFSILAALFMHIGVSFYAGAVVFESMFGINIVVSNIIIAIFLDLLISIFNVTYNFYITFTK